MSSSNRSERPGIDDRSALKLVTEMMAIPGKSCEEGRVVQYVRQRLTKAGVPASSIVIDTAHRRSPAGGEVGNLIVKLPGTKRGPRRMMIGHLDTVPLCEGSQPVRKGPLIVSRDPRTALGGDNRAGASVVLNAVLEIQRRQLAHPPLTLFWPVQEEIGLYGARYSSLNRLGSPRLCFNWDGSAPHVATIGATGDFAIRIEVEGIASHAGAYPERGVSAVAVAGLAIADLTENGWHGLIIKGRKSGTSNIGIVQAGTARATNVVVPNLTLLAEARSHDPKFRKRIVEEYRKAFQKAVKKVNNNAGKTAHVQFEAELKYDSFRLAEDEPAVTTALSVIRAAGLKPEMKVANGGLDANWMTARGLPTVTMGCGQQDAHTVDESLHVASFLHACRVGLLIATGVD